ncbi:MAG: MFS transporter [Solirubrobacterales bacterium]
MGIGGSNADSESDDARSQLTLDSTAGRWTMAAAVLGTSMVFLDGTVVNIALPAIGDEFGASITGLQWIVNGYLLTLASLVLLGGALGDRYGRARIFQIGVIGFTLASVLCALATSTELLIAGRILQGVGGALLTPGSLAIIEASFVKIDRARAIGVWSGLAGASMAVGPPLGGYLVEAVGWRSVFFINVPIGIAVALIAWRKVPESRDTSLTGSVDFPGAVLAVVTLAAASYALIEGPDLGPTSPTVIASLLASFTAAAVFLLVERRTREPMLPLKLFSNQTFSAANLVTFLVYAAFGGALFLLVVLLQTGMGYSPILAGAATLPVTIMMLLFSSRAGALAQRVGARTPLTVGSVVIALSLALMSRLGIDSDYLTDVLPTVTVLAIGLTIVVAPVTATTLGAVPDENAGVASAVSNAVSRTGQLFAIALLPAVGGLSGEQYDDPTAIASAFETAALFAAGVCLLGAVVAWTLIDRDALKVGEPELVQPADCGLAGAPLVGAEAVRSADG